VILKILIKFETNYQISSKLSKTGISIIFFIFGYVAVSMQVTNTKFQTFAQTWS